MTVDREIFVTPDMIIAPGKGDWTVKTADEILAVIRSVGAHHPDGTFTHYVAQGAIVPFSPFESIFVGPESTVRDRRPVTPREAQKRIAKRRAQKRARKT